LNIIQDALAGFLIDTFNQHGFLEMEFLQPNGTAHVNEPQTRFESRRLGIAGNTGTYGTIPDLPQRVRILVPLAATLSQYSHNGACDGRNFRGWSAVVLHALRNT
jgi:hypothetical protein